MANKQVLLLLSLVLGLWRTADCACTYGDVKLVNGPSVREGRVEICINNVWGTVCDDLWGTADARVVCNQLNYDANGAVAYSGAQYGAGTGTIWLDNVRCLERQLKLIWCPKNALGVHNCNHNEDAGVYCPPCYEGNVWLPVGSTYREGTVEICHDGVWGTICDDQFGTQEAQVLCSQLGYEREGAQAFGNAYFGERYGPIIYDNLGCTGSEKNISQCTGNPVGVNNCDHSEDAGIRCPICEKGSIRLWSAYDYTPSNEGMIHYCHTSGVWKAMCRYQWGCLDAKVACRNLGYNGTLDNVQALVNVEGAYGYFKPVLPQRVYCDGSESVLQDCNFVWTTWCDSVLFETAGVRCAAVESNECTNGDMRLVNDIDDDPDSGRVEYCFHGDWSPFCGMDDEEATVACKQLGYTDYSWAALFDDERFGSDGQVSDFDSIECSEDASEAHMINCSVNYSPGCDITSCPTEYGIKCFNPGSCTDGDLRLYSGVIEQEGTVEMCLNGVWGYLCSNNMAQTDAYVICRQMGYDGDAAPVVYTNNFFGDRSFPIVWSDVTCGGWEKSILDCSRSEYLSFDCTRQYIVGVQCFDDCTDNDVRLVGGTTDYQGTVEVCLDDIWGLVSETGWNDDDTTVVCRSLGFSGEGAVTYYGSYFGRPNKTVHYSNVFCNGAEDSLEECTKTAITLTEGKTTYSNASVVGVDCSPIPPTDATCIVMNVTTPDPTQCTDGDVRLTNQTGDAGRLEYCYSGQWSPFCQIDEVTASVACKQLGYEDFTYAAIYTDGSFGSSSNYSLFSNITCSASTPDSLSQCTLNPTDCLPLCNNIALRCFNPGECQMGQIRLADGFVDHEGRVEHCHQGVWTSVCDEGWDTTDGHVACQQLGLPELEPHVFHNSYFGDGMGPIVISNLQCVGFETNITDCDRDFYPTFSCSRDHVAGVLCGANCDDGDLRLVNGMVDNEGTVEVCYDGVWGNIGESGWSEKDAGLVCSLLGYLADDPIVRTGSYFGETAAAILISDLICTGQEATILGCSYTVHSVPEGKDLITKSYVAGVTCAVVDTCDEPPTLGNNCSPEGSLQLVGAEMEEGNEGTLMYCTQGYWSPFCSIDPIVAGLACAYLGYSDIMMGAIIGDGRYNPSTNLSYFQNFTCSELATSLSECTLNRPCNKECATPYGIRCYSQQGECEENSVRLAGGYLPNEGRVEVCMNNMWGGVCSDSWSQIDALVVCNQLGLGTAEPIIYTDSSAYGEVYGPYYYSNIQCQGWETTILDCPKNDYYNTMCPRSSPASQICRDDCTDGDIKLVGGDEEYEGTVVMCRNNYWGLIAQTTWDINDAMVVCTQLGYPNDGTIARVNSYYGKPNITLITSSVNCNGSETSMSQCDITYLSFDDGKVAAAHVAVAGVFCLPTPTTTPFCQTAPDAPTVCSNGDVRLADTIDGESGRVEYCHNGQWSAFCSIDAATASVACYQLGFTRYTWATLMDDGVYASPMDYSLFGSLKCTGEERRLINCAITDVDCLPTCDTNAAIRCYNPGACIEGDRRLADGVFDQRGRVELCINGLWGTVCDDGWDDTDALSFCADLGFPGTGVSSSKGSLYGPGTGPAIYSNVQCGGWETDFDDCLKSKYPAISCTNSNLAGAMCAFDCSDGEVRLVDGNRRVQEFEGTVEICYNNLWGMIVGSEGWDTNDARVVCNQLGFDTSNAVAKFQSPRPNDPVHRTAVGCSGSEASLADCSATALNVDDSQNYQNVAGVSCKQPVVSTPSSNVSTTSVAPSANTDTQTDTNNNSTLTVVVVILGLFTLLGIIVSAVIIGLVCFYQRRGSPDKTMKQPRTTRRTSEMEPGFTREVVNPLSTEPGLEGDDDENTKHFQDLIEESQLK